MESRKFIETTLHDYLKSNTIREYLNGQVKNSDKDLNILFDLAKQYEDPYKFDDYLNRDKFGHNRNLSFLRERFSRLNRGTRLNNNGKINIFRTSDEPIKWGDYIYLDVHDAQRAYNAGQGNKIYKKIVPSTDVVETSVSGEFYYSPIKIAKIGEDLIDLWYYTHGKSQNKQNNSDNLKDRIKLFKKELIKMKGKYDDFNEYENEVINIANKYNVPIENYEEYFY